MNKGSISVSRLTAEESKGGEKAAGIGGSDGVDV